VKFGGKLSGAIEEYGGGVQADDTQSTLRQGDRMSPVTATNVDDARRR
jgi:hypothetical protein